MRVNDNHMYHGAALIQIAEHPQFTAINSLNVPGQASRNAYRINDNIAVYLKYAGEPTPAFGEFVFTFTKDHLADLSTIADAVPQLFLALVCVKAEEICCLSYQELTGLVQTRRTAAGKAENQYAILVTAPKNKSLRVYVNQPGEKKVMAGKALTISRNAFPDKVFH
ncbi:MAG: hypothetical protein A3K19_10275 [Lentisphaerae bacterium RIFOXYB12_FULL_65_16]|nr:MAG: hypothetical protein A3K18_32135 [Lentisphaerae bacterium RIFOXYA12_64_32]OGV91602.1 MAG: hypothetical protein A3K19_10275 [Lentisphaerae bacterium RIFOXYB12_FULL_65_16]